MQSRKPSAIRSEIFVHPVKCSLRVMSVEKKIRFFFEYVDWLKRKKKELFFH